MTTPNSALQKTGPTALKALLDQPSYKSRFVEILGARAPQFAASIVQVQNGSNQLLACDSKSIIAAALTAAILDLPIDKNLGFAHIVPYGGLAQFQMGYKGFVQLAIRSGQYRLLNSCEVRKGELVSFNRLTGQLVIDPDKKETDEVVGYAAYFMLNNGYEHGVYWTVAEVVAHASKYSQAYKAQKKDSPWFTKFDSMAKKTVIKDLISHWGIMSVQMQKAVVEDQGVHRDIDSEVEYIDNSDSPEAAVNRAEVKEPAMGTAGATAPVVTTDAPPVGKDILFDAAKPYDSLNAMMKRDNLTEEQVLNYVKALQLAGPKVGKLAEMREANVLKICENWPHHLEEIKKLKA